MGTVPNGCEGGTRNVRRRGVPVSFRHALWPAVGSRWAGSRAAAAGFDLVARANRGVLESDGPHAWLHRRRRDILYSRDGGGPGDSIPKASMEQLGRRGDADRHRGAATMAG